MTEAIDSIRIATMENGYQVYEVMGHGDMAGRLGRSWVFESMTTLFAWMQNNMKWFGQTNPEK